MQPQYPVIYRYILSECIGRQISVPVIFPTYDDAWCELKQRYLQVTNGDKDKGFISRWHGYAETANHEPIDWKIESVAISLQIDEIKKLQMLP